MPEVSIIVSVYKVEKYLERCVKSILAQTLKNIEIILVDDGSPDRCGLLCDEYAINDSRIKVIHKTNGGVSSARNVGLAVAEGEYILFVDADDMISEQMIEILYCSALKMNADMVMCEYTVINEVTSSMDCFDLNKTNAMEISTFDAFLVCANFGKRIQMMVWNKLFRRQTIKSILFDEAKKMAEDIEFLAKSFTMCEKIVYVPLELYGYFVKRHGSAMSARHDIEWYTTQFNNVKESMDILIDWNHNFIIPASAYSCVNGALSCANGMARIGQYKGKLTHELRVYLLRNMANICASNLSVAKKIQILFFVFSPRLYFWGMKNRFR